MTSEPQPVVAFDFDGTLTHRDTLLPFLKQVVGRPALTRCLARAQFAWRFGGERGRDRAKRALLAATLAGQPHAELRSLGASYANELIDHGLRDDVAVRLAQHQAEDHRIIIVSASLSYYLDPLAQLLGIDDVICCRLGVDTQGLCTGTFDAANLRGQAKVDQLRDLLGPDPTLASAYGNDNTADGPMLDLAHRSVLVDHHPLIAMPVEIIDPDSASLQVPWGTIQP